MIWVWGLLVLLRFSWTILPQTGYIHPDEFFQTVEIVAGDVLDIDVFQSWEFNTSMPIRSIVIPHLIIGVPLRILKWLHGLGLYPGLMSNSYHLLMVPRLIMTFLSLLLDFCVYKISRNMGIDWKMALVLISSSYVTLTYQTRTLTNSVETLLFSALLMLLFVLAERRNKRTTMEADSNRTHSSHRKRQHRKSKHPEMQETAPTVTSLESNFFQDLSLSCLISVIIVAGIFNRPTFVAFAASPLAWFVIEEIKSLLNMPWTGKSNCRLSMLCILVAVSGCITTIIFCVTDSIYFGRSLQKLWLDVSDCFFSNTVSESLFSCLRDGVSNNVVSTPWNFVEYNKKAGNLAEHGLHPRYLHFIVNLPLLFGPLVGILFYSLYTQGRCLIFPNVFPHDKAKPKGKAKTKKFCPLEILILVPVLWLSLFPHQEARFLSPLLLPAILLATRQCTVFSRGGKAVFLALWIPFNVLLALFFGVFHQGGVVPSTIYLQKILTASTTSKQHLPPAVGENVPHILYYHTYMPPQHLLLQPKMSGTFLDLKGSDFSELKKVLDDIFKSEFKMEPSVSEQILIVTPAPVAMQILPELTSIYNRTVFIRKKLFPHFSSEDLFNIPSVSDISSWSSLEQLFFTVIDQLSLYILQIE